MTHQSTPAVQVKPPAITKRKTRSIAPPAATRQTHGVPAAKPTVAAHSVAAHSVAAPSVAAAVLGSAHGHAGDLARTLLLTLAILFLLLAALPWRQVLHYHLVPAQLLRLRVTFAAVAMSVAFGYVIAVYMSGSV